LIDDMSIRVDDMGGKQHRFFQITLVLTQKGIGDLKTAVLRCFEGLAAYRAAPFRPPALAGGSYPENPADLYLLLQNYLEAAVSTPDPACQRGLLSPHIDYPRGGPVYAEVWKRASPLIQAADVVVVLGTDHFGGHNPITLTRQHYATPYGVLPTEQTIVDHLAAALGEQAAFAAAGTPAAQAVLSFG